jgi:hypothetical protein
MRQIKQVQSDETSGDEDDGRMATLGNSSSHSATDMLDQLVAAKPKLWLCSTSKPFKDRNRLILWNDRDELIAARSLQDSVCWSSQKVAVHMRMLWTPVADTV